MEARKEWYRKSHFLWARLKLIKISNKSIPPSWIQKVASPPPHYLMSMARGFSWLAHERTLGNAAI